MRKARDNEALVRSIQGWLRTRGHDIAVDGWAGRRTRSALREAMKAEGLASPAAEPLWPAPDEGALTDFYGPPGPAEQVYIEPAYPMVLSYDPDTPLRRIQCHRLVADSLRGVLEDLLSNMGMDWIRRHNLHEFGGAYFFRPMRRDPERMSTHAWGIAIDLASRENGLTTPWPDVAPMPIEAVEAFEARGWTSLARRIGRDAMHFQATSW